MRRIWGVRMKVGREDKGCLEMYIRLRRMAKVYDGCKLTWLTR
jgi:hypothetical protein